MHTRYWHILRQPFFVVSSVLLIAHQLAQKIWHYPIPWADSYLDNLLCMPVLLSLLLVDQRWKRSDTHYSFSLFEIAIITLVFSILFEVFFPKWKPEFTSDFQDVVYYFTGSGLFYFFNKNNKRINHKQINKSL